MSIIQICYSDDGGHNWSNWREVSIGQTGEYQHRERVRRLGSARTRRWKIQCAAASTVHVLGAIAQQNDTDG